MKTKPNVIVAAVTLLGIAIVFCTASAQATTFPLVSVPTTFTGSMTLDPTTPCTLECNAYDTLFKNPGTITITFGGTTWSQAISFVSVDYSPFPGPPESDWSEDSDSESEAFNLILGGSMSSSLSLNPLPLSSYSDAFFAASGDSSTTGVVYQGDVASLTSVQNGSLINYSFNGSFDRSFFFPLPTPLPDALPLFATGLGALGLFGWCRKRKAVAIAA